MVSHLLDAAIITIFARETLEGGIIIGEYRTVILRSNDWEGASTNINNNDGSDDGNRVGGVQQNDDDDEAPSSTRRSRRVATTPTQQQQQQQEALQAVTVAAVGAASLALLICCSVAIPLAILSKNFNNRAALLIEGISKIVASICILQLSLKLPKFFGLYTSKKKNKQKQQQQEQQQKNNKKEEKDGDEDGDDVGDEEITTLSIPSIRFNVAWNICREVAECGVFLIPFFLNGDGVLAIPLSALVGFMVGGLICLAIYRTNQKLRKPLSLTVFSVTILVFLSTGMFCGGSHMFEVVYGETTIVWTITKDIWSTNRLPMTILKPFGYSNSRTILQMVCFWGWLLCAVLLHYRKWKECHTSTAIDEDTPGVQSNNTPARQSTIDEIKQPMSHPRETVEVDTRSTFSD